MHDRAGHRLVGLPHPYALPVRAIHAHGSRFVAHPDAGLLPARGGTECDRDQLPRRPRETHVPGRGGADDAEAHRGDVDGGRRAARVQVADRGAGEGEAHQLHVRAPVRVELGKLRRSQHSALVRLLRVPHGAPFAPRRPRRTAVLRQVRGRLHPLLRHGAVPARSII